MRKEFKKEFKEEISEPMYVVKWMLIRFVIVVMIIGFLFGGYKLVYKKTFGKATKTIEREIFKEGVAYNEAAASFLADSYYQYISTEDEIEKSAIKNYVRMKYQNLDMDGIENSQLRSFYSSCLREN